MYNSRIAHVTRRVRKLNVCIALNSPCRMVSNPAPQKFAIPNVYQISRTFYFTRLLNPMTISTIMTRTHTPTHQQTNTHPPIYSLTYRIASSSTQWACKQHADYIVNTDYISLFAKEHRMWTDTPEMNMCTLYAQYCFPACVCVYACACVYRVYVCARTRRCEKWAVPNGNIAHPLFVHNISAAGDGKSRS